MNRLASILVYGVVLGIFFSLGTPVTLLVLTLEVLIFSIFLLLLTCQWLEAWPGGGPRDPMEIGLLVILVLLLIQPIFLEIPDKNAYFNSMLKVSAAFALYASIKAFFGTREKVRDLVRYVVALSALFALGILLQTFLASGARPENIRQSFLANLPRPITLWTARTVDTNNLVDLFFPGSFLALALLLYTLERKRDRDLPPEEATHEVLWYGFFSALSLAGIFFSYSRGGILAFVAGLGLFSLLLLMRRRRGRVQIFSVTFLALLFFLVTLDLGRVFEELMTLGEMLTGQEVFKTEAGLRWEGPAAALHLLGRVWPLGGGAGNLTAAWLLHRPEELQLIPYTIHNDFLQIAVESGVGAFLIVLGLALWTATIFLRGIFRTQSRWTFYLGLAIFAASVSFTAHSLIDPTFLVEPILWLFLGGLALGVNVVEIDPEKRERKLPIARRPRLRIGLIVLTLGTVGMIGLAGRKLSAHLVAQFRGVEYHPLASQLDPWNAYFDTQAAFLYRGRYLQEKDPQLLENSLRAVDRAIQKGPFVPQSYALKAQLLYRLGRTEELDSVFALMKRRFPNHYEQFVVPAAFYLEKAVESKTRKERVEFTRKGLTAYRRAVELLSKFMGANYFEYYRVYLEDPFNLDLVRELIRKHGIPESGPLP